MRRFVVLTAVVLAGFGGRTSTADARSSAFTDAKVRYYHADGIVKWIGKHAKVTQYNPNIKKKRHWQKAVTFYVKVRKEAWLVMHPKPKVTHPSLDQALVASFSCIHQYEGAWNAATGNGYYGGLQMDLAFQSRYGSDYMRLWGTANNWPIWAQLNAAIRAYKSGRGFYPWPNTARACGLI